MKKFLKDSLLFLLLAAMLFHVKPLILLYDDLYKKVVAGTEVYVSLLKSKSKSKCQKLLLGDSVARQLFDNKGSDEVLNSLASNQAISMAGQYILLYNYLNQPNQVDTVYLLYHPESFRNNLYDKYTYHYFLKPFFTNEYKPLLSETALKQISRIPFYQFCRYPSILTSNWAPNISKDSISQYTFISPVSGEYLARMEVLSRQHNATFKVIAPPVAESKRRSVEKMEPRELQKYGLEECFSDYFSSLKYLPDSLFVDGTHYKDISKIKILGMSTLISPNRDLLPILKN